MRIISATLFLISALALDALTIPRVSEVREPKWKQVAVLHSTRSDVERLPGKSKDKGYIASYKVEGGSVDIEYYTSDFCEPGQEGGWNVSRWTVIGIAYDPFEKQPQFSSLNLDLTRFRKVRENPCCPDLISYINDEEGITYVVNPEGTLNKIEYSPSSQYAYLRCTKKSK